MSTPLRVLLISDSATDAAVLLQTLRDGGYDPLCERVETATALEAALDRHAWEVVLCADVLPHFSALAALRLLQNRGLDLPFLIVATESGEARAVDAMKAGAHDYVLKDNLVRLVPAIERELREARQRRVYGQMSQKLNEQAERARPGAEPPSELIAILTADGSLRYVSSSSERLLGYTPQELTGTHFRAHLHPDDQQATWAALSDLLRHPDASATVTFRFRHKQGLWHLLEATSTSFHDEATGGTSLVLTSRDLTNAERSLTLFKSRLLHDVLTDVPSRALFHDQLQQMLRAAQHRRKPLALLLISVPHFRAITKTFGHQWGEVLLQQVGARLRGALRRSDALVRVDGDAFVVLLPPGGDATTAKLVARRILKVLEQPLVVEGQALSVRANIGIALYPEHGADAQTLMRRADIATEIAARAWSGYAVYAAKHDQYSRERLLLVSELYNAFKRDQLVLHYQPKAHLATGRIEYVEALVRWQHPRHGLLPPEQFLPLAEQTGLTKPLSLWVLNTALRQCHAWRQQGLDLCVAINFSMQHDLQDPHLPDTVARTLQACEVPPTRLEVEITESPFAENPDRALTTLNRFRDMGVRIAIDDFGTGYSSLRYLRQLPVDEVKIDKSLVTGMTKDESSVAIVRSTIALGHDLGLQVAAEGVEDQATWELLAAFGCDFAQGYYLSRPVSATAFTRWLTESARGKGGRPVPLAAPRRAKRRDTAIGEV
ncbi:MAG: EAL domain-containing protein [Thermodesulfobacteriota bacterium]|jgi:diguanylate cyclase (GGDEF)-like protein/PAS domain S-box-containing protein